MTEPTDVGPSTADQLFRLIRSFGYTTHGQTAEIVDAIVAKWGTPPQISESDTDYWVRNRALILQAIEERGFRLVSSGGLFWLSGPALSSTTNGQGAPNALRLADALAYCDSSVASQAARELRRLHAENAALQQVYDATQLEIDHLRGVTKMVAPAGEYPTLPTGSAWCGDDDVRDFGAGAGESALMFEPTQTQHVPLFTAGQMRAYVDADRAMRAQAASATDSYVQPVPDKCDRITWRGGYYHLPLETPQPPQPVAWQSRTRPTWGSNTTPWYPWESCTKEQAEDYWKTPLLHGWAYEARALYIAPQPAPVAQGDALTPAARDVLAERQRQIIDEGWTPEHDDKAYLRGELALAAASYVCADEQYAPPATWPWGWSWWKPRDRRRNLVKSGALILAEIERIDRSQAKQGANHDNP